MHSTAATRDAQNLLLGWFFFLPLGGWSAAARLPLELRSGDSKPGVAARREGNTGTERLLQP